MTIAGYEVKAYPPEGNTQTDISFKRRPPDQPQPNAEESAFADKAISTLSRINTLMSLLHQNYASTNEYRDYYERVLFAAQNGVGQGIGDLGQGEIALNSARQYFAEHQGPFLRKLFLYKLHKATALVLVIALLALGLLEISKITTIAILGLNLLPQLQCFLAAVVGLCLGNWAYRMLTNETLSWDNLERYGSSLYPPIIRYILLMVLIIIVMLLLGKEVIELKILSFNLNNVVFNPTDAILLGVFAGMAEKRLTATVMKAFAEKSK
ncbi:hypothetical protein [Aliiglaciecola sp. LCG003]|uniref:hypothetical protein n=1 Tax=Aliiglaciecola sp. LCG003 TaxID=3053655 RepID=UPI00257460DD|nr:hypothetical protein [Aliiglaciecola sp. LCG003]WJG10693.1 hypothetical protein QR722_06530 [Aliiglaciecola sp. LCG003]